MLATTHTTPTVGDRAVDVAEGASIDRRGAHYSWTWNDWAGGLGGEMNGFVLWCSCCWRGGIVGRGLTLGGAIIASDFIWVTPSTHSASNGSLALFIDLARLWNARAGGRRGAGDVLWPIWLDSHWSGLGRSTDVLFDLSDSEEKTAAGSSLRGDVSGDFMRKGWTCADGGDVVELPNEEGGNPLTVSGKTDGIIGDPIKLLGTAFVFWLMLMMLLKLRSSLSSVRVSSDRPWLSSWHSWLTVSVCLFGDTSGMGDTVRTCCPLFLGSRNAFWRSALDGRSLMRNDICRLNGDWLPTARKLPCRSRRSRIIGVGCGRSMANGLWGFGCGVTIAAGSPPPISTPRSLFCNRSVIVWARNEPLRVNVEFFMSNVIVTPHSVSRRCLRSKHTANAHPTACDRRSPESLVATNPWHIQRRVVPSRQM